MYLLLTKLALSLSLVSTALAGCAHTRTVETRESSLIRIEMDGGGRTYLIDPPSESCFLAYRDSLVRVECASLAANVPGAKDHITWATKPEPPRPAIASAAQAGADSELELRKRAEFVAKLDAGIKRVGDNHVSIDRALRDEIIANPKLVKGARVVPSIKDGKPHGFKIYAIRADSFFRKVGLQNGDTVIALNGMALGLDNGLEVYNRTKSARVVVVDLVRRGAAVQIIVEGR